MPVQDNVLQARQMDEASTVLINAGVAAVKRNPIKVGMYVVGLLICFFFNGLKVSEEKRSLYEIEMDNIDYRSLEVARRAMLDARYRFHSSRGWFYSCDDLCTRNKEIFHIREAEFKNIEDAEREKVREAKSIVGIFSTYGVEETKQAFYDYFAKGKNFAQRQSKWDALFMGIDAMGRDEGMASYLLRLLLSVLINFTLGMIGAVSAFIFSLYGLIQTFKAPLWQGIIYFFFASLAAISFALTWIFGMYVAAAGTVYVSAKMISANLRLEGGRHANPRGRVRYD